MMKIIKNGAVVYESHNEKIALSVFAQELHGLYDMIEDPDKAGGSKQSLTFEDHKTNGFISITAETGKLKKEPES